jgi:hypothetical protein
LPNAVSAYLTTPDSMHAYVIEAGLLKIRNPHFLDNSSSASSIIFTLDREPGPDRPSLEQEPSKMAIMEQVVSTPELLECVILNLSIQDALINASRVSRAWYNIIQHSPRLQQHLFFAPKNVSPTGRCEWTKNPLLAEKFPAWFRDVRETGRWFLDQNDIQNYMEHPGPYKSFSFTDEWTMKDSDWAARPDAYARPEASWRRMLVMQPSVKHFRILYAQMTRRGWRKDREVQDVATGLRMDLLYDMVIEKVAQFRIRFAFQWNMFDIKEDSEAREYSDGDASPTMALIEKEEDLGSLILIWKDHLRSFGERFWIQTNKASDDFRSKASTNNRFEDVAPRI